MAVERPTKLSHASTVLYEIDALRFAFVRLTGAGEGSWDEWAYLECFLLHFRNLIEFFGKRFKRRPDSLSIRNPRVIWPGQETVPSDEALAELHRDDLWKKYEVRDQEAGERRDTISRYPQHCTEERVSAKSWPVKSMFDELNSTLTKFEQLFPREARSWEEPDRAGRLAAPASFSTLTRGAD